MHKQKRYTQNNTASPLVYNNMGWLGDSSHHQYLTRFSAVQIHKSAELQHKQLIR